MPQPAPSAILAPLQGLEPAGERWFLGMKISLEGLKVLRDLSGKLTHRQKIVYGVGAATVVAVGAAIIAASTIARASKRFARAYQHDDDTPLGI